MSDRPAVALAMVPMLTAQLFDEHLLARLRAVCDVPQPEPLVTFEEPRAEGLLKITDILLTSWGCPPIDRHVLDRAPRLRAIVHAAALRARLAELELELPVDDEPLSGPASPLAEPLAIAADRTLRNRFVIQPMEGWDGTREGRPTALTVRRWRRVLLRVPPRPRPPLHPGSERPPSAPRRPQRSRRIAAGRAGLAESRKTAATRARSATVHLRAAGPSRSADDALVS